MGMYVCACGCLLLMLLVLVPWTYLEQEISFQAFFKSTTTMGVGPSKTTGCGVRSNAIPDQEVGITKSGWGRNMGTVMAGRKGSVLAKCIVGDGRVILN